MHKAAKEGQMDVLTALLDKGADKERKGCGCLKQIVNDPTCFACRSFTTWDVVKIASYVVAMM